MFPSPLSGSRWKELNDAFEEDGTWDSPGKIVLLGVLVPLLVLAWVGWQIATGEAVFPSKGRREITFGLFDEPLPAFGLLLLEFAFAGWAFSKYVIGNHPRWGWHSEPIRSVLVVVMLVSGAMAFLGLLLRLS